MVERAGLENRCGGNSTEGSNPSLSATYPLHTSPSKSVFILKDADLLALIASIDPLVSVANHRYPQSNVV